LTTFLDLVTVKGWGKEKLAEGLGMYSSGKNGQGEVGGEGKYYFNNYFKCPIHHPSTNQAFKYNSRR